MAAPPKILFTSPTMNAGGAERVLITLANHINREKFAPEFLAVSDAGPLRELLKDDIPYHALSVNKKVERSVPLLIKKLIALRPDIIISTQAHMNFAVLLAHPFLKHKPKIIIREAIQPSYFLTPTLRGRLIRCLYKTLYPNAHAIMAPAESIIDEFKNLIKSPPEKYHVLYNPVDESRITAQPQRNTDPATRHFVCAGRLHWQKGYDRLIRALKNFSPPYNWTLDIWGEGIEFIALQKLIEEENLAAHVFMKGYTDKPWQEMASADALLLPSRSEGLPNVVLESLSVGTPVIASVDAGGIAEIKNRSPEGAVTIAQNMQDFTALMESIPAKQNPQSLLADTFKLENCIKRFEDLMITVYNA